MIKAILIATAISALAFASAQAQTVQTTPNVFLPPGADNPANPNLAKDTTPPGTVDSKKPLSNALKRPGNRTSATQGYIAEDTTPPGSTSTGQKPLSQAFEQTGDKGTPGRQY